MKTPLTFLLALAFLYFFSGNIFGFFFKKFEEEKYKGTNIGVNACTVKNIEIMNKAYPGADERSGRKERNQIRIKCREEHSKLSEEGGIIGGKGLFYSHEESPTDWFETTLRNKSDKKIITSVTIEIKYNNKNMKTEEFETKELWILPGEDRFFRHDPTTTEEMKSSETWEWSIIEVKYVDFALK